MEAQVFTGQERITDEILVSEHLEFLCHISVAYLASCFKKKSCLQGAVIGPQQRRFMDPPPPPPLFHAQNRLSGSLLLPEAAFCTSLLSSTKSMYGKGLIE